MSQTLTLSVLPLSDAERADVRRFTGYPLFGDTAAGFMGYRFFVAFGELEYRMTNMAPAELQITRYYLASLYPLETAIPAASGTLGTESAAVWTRNPNEIRERMGLLAEWGRKLAAFMGVPPGPALGEGGLRIVV
jgi:hypothetical protein